MKSIHRKRYKEITALLVEKRKLAGVTQKQLARVLHLRQNIISKIETNERRIDLLELIQYLDGLNVPFRDFVNEVSIKILKQKDGNDRNNDGDC